MSQTKDRINELLSTSKPLNFLEEFELLNLVARLDEDDTFKVSAYAAIDQLEVQGLVSSQE